MRRSPILQGGIIVGVPSSGVHRALALFPFAVLLSLVVAPGIPASAAETTTLADVQPELEDAELVDVAFVDRWHGWVVGDRGVIWHTADGGRSWRLQPSGVDCHLASVQFLNAKDGWAAGGGALPPGDLSRGAIVTTHDGGRSWQPARRLSLPAIRKLRYLDPQHGWCVGEPSALFPAGGATTSDGGRTWVPITGEGRRGWLSGDFISPNEGVLVGRSGALATVRRRGIESGNTPSLGLRAIHSVRLNGDSTGWLVGDAGLVLTTTNNATSWQVPDTEPPGIVGQFDWQVVATQGSSLWIAGEPGSRILHSDDGGTTWSLQSTGQSLPLYGLNFADSRHGWAVGALGTILATADGGKTWRRQRAGGGRAAWLAVYSEPRDLPLELWGRLAAGEGYLGAVDFVARRDAASDAPDETRFGRSRAAGTVGTGSDFRPDGLAIPAAGTGGAALSRTDSGELESCQRRSSD